MSHEEISSPPNRIESAADLLAKGLLRLTLRDGVNRLLSVQSSSKRLDFLAPKREQADSTEAG